MFFKKIKDELGNCVDANGVKWYVMEGERILTKAGVNVGCEEFPSRDACLSAWGLTEVPEEEMFPQEEANE